MVPSGLLPFCVHQVIPIEADALNGIEGETKVASNKEVGGNRNARRLANLRARIQTQFKGTSAIRSVKGENCYVLPHGDS